MSLYYKERSDEEIADLENDKIVFTFPWIIELPPHPNGVLIRGRITTAYSVVHSSWHMYFSRIGIKLRNYNFSNQTRVWNGTCFISYNLFCDTDMRYLFHGSIPCRRIVLNLTSKLMRMRFAEKKDVEMAVEHSNDVVKHVVTYLNRGEIQKIHITNKNFYETTSC